MKNQGTPPVSRGECVKTPEGPGRVTAFSQVPEGWLLRVDLDAGRHWVGLASAVLHSDTKDPSKTSGKRPRGKGRRR